MDTLNAGSDLVLKSSPNQKPATYNEPRMLTRSEIELLRRNKQELARQIMPLIKR